VFLNIIKSLQIDVNDFFKDINSLPIANKVIFKKKAQNQHFEKENAIGFSYQRLLSTTINDQHLDFVILTLQPNASRPMVSTDAYEFKLLLKGKVEYVIGNETFLMEEGDTLLFDATTLHNPRNIGEGDAILLVVYLFNKPA
jgi:mannose-6-phosphate isomerase-like protein (cupin superfamily)